MKKEIITTLTNNFEIHVQQTEDGIEYWLARDLQHLLGYDRWENFAKVISKAKSACDTSGQEVSHNFVEVSKTVIIGGGTTREIDDVMLTRYACYLIAQNGDPKKEQIAFAQTYFAIQTRRAELIEQRILEQTRISARHKLTQKEKELSNVIFEQTGKNKNFAIIRSKGDKALFGKNTREMKAQWKVPDNRPLADFAPTIILKAKEFAAEITIHKAMENNMNTESEISNEHITNNNAVRQTLIERGIRPETLHPAEDIKKTERRITAENKKTLKSSNNLKDKKED